MLFAIGRGLAPVTSGFVRFLLSPVTIVGIVLVVVLMRLRRTTSSS